MQLQDPVAAMARGRLWLQTYSTVDHALCAVNGTCYARDRPLLSRGCGNDYGCDCNARGLLLPEAGQEVIMYGWLTTGN